jgi:hypothetical protein
VAERVPVLVGTALIMAAIAGCTTAQGGTATTAGQPPPGASAVPAPPDGPARITLPPRPVDVPLTGVDPCSLLTARQRGTLGLATGAHGLPDQLADNSPTCNFRLADPTSGVEYDVAVDTRNGIQLFLDPHLAANVRQVSVAGFPALDITLKPPDLLQGCTTAVSVAGGQMFMVNLGQPAEGTTTTQSCARTEQVADAVLTTARTLK